MTVKNTLVHKYVVPYYIGASIFFGIAGATTIVDIKHAKENQEFAQKHPDIETQDSLDSLSIILIIASILLGCFGFRVVPKQATQKASDLTHRYINDMIFKNPELKQYASVLTNEELLEKMAAVICNGLDEKSQQEIIKISKQFKNLDTNSDFNEKEQIWDIDEQIIDVVKRYAEQNPAYIANVRAMLAKLGTTYVMTSENQQTR